MKLILNGCALVACLISPVTAAEYSVLDLGPGVARSINNSGKVAGYDTTGGFTYDAVQGRQATPPLTVYLPDDPSQPPGYGPYFSLIQVQWLGINDNGLLVGSGVMSNRFQPVPPLQDLSPYPLIWSGAGDPVILLGQQGVKAAAANSAGVVVGGAFRYALSTQELIGTGLIFSMDVNEAGVIAGSVSNPDTGQLPAIWKDGVVQPIPVFNPGSFAWRYGMTATAINAAGQLAGNIGYGDFSGSYSRGFLWSPTKTNLIDAPVEGLYGNEVTVNGLNDGGLVVGRWKGAQGSKAFLFRNETFIDLNTLIPTGGWQLTAAYSINEAGQIVGEGILNGAARAFLLNPLDPGQGQPPSIVQQPAGGRFGLGESTTLTVSATGTPPLSYQWQHAGTNLVGETGQSLVLADLSAADSGSYRVIIKNTAGEATSLETVIAVLDPEIGVLRFTGVTVTGAIGGLYQIDGSPSLTTPTWTPLTQITLTQSPQVWIDLQSGTNTGPRFYRSSRVLP